VGADQIRGRGIEGRIDLEAGIDPAEPIRNTRPLAEISTVPIHHQIALFIYQPLIVRQHIANPAVLLVSTEGQNGDCAQCGNEGCLHRTILSLNYSGSYLLASLTMASACVGVAVPIFPFRPHDHRDSAAQQKHPHDECGQSNKPVAVSRITTAAATITELSFSAGGHFHCLVTSGTL
jgi:hypothetical protein